MPDTNEQPITLVPGRECGECIACCVNLRIASPDFNKPANVLCRHCNGAGCAVYETRPDVCKTYYCAWRQVAELNDSWRPDRSGVILSATPVEGYATPTGLSMIVTDGENTIRRPYFAPFVADMVRHRRAIFMSVNDRKALLNPHLEAIVPLGVDAVRAQLLRFHAAAFTESPTLSP